MPLITTIGASTRRGFDFVLPPNVPVLWYDNGVLAQGAAYNLQGDGLYHNYINGVDQGTYTGAYQINGVWNRILFGNVDSYVNGYYNLDGNSKWYYEGNAANGYIANLPQLAITIEGDGSSYYVPTSILSGWHYFTDGVDNGSISGEHNVDGQGNKYFKDGGLFNGNKINNDNLWHYYLDGVESGLTNNVEFTDYNSTDPYPIPVILINGSVPTAVNTTSSSSPDAVPVLVIKGALISGNYYIADYSFAAQTFRGYLNYTGSSNVGGLFTFNNGVCAGAVYGWSTSINAAWFGTETFFFRDGQMLDDIIYNIGNVLYFTGVSLEYGFALDEAQAIEGYNATYANPDLQGIYDVYAPLSKKLYFINASGALGSKGCQQLVVTDIIGLTSIDYYCVGDYGEVLARSYYYDTSACNSCAS
jgi:hypothetical protein